MRTKIHDIASYLPERIVCNEELLSLVNQENFKIPKGILGRLYGSKERRFAKKDEQVSDMAARAAEQIIHKIGKEKIDLLIFAAACSDLIEPATSNIIQSKLGLSCPCMDIKNACNSVVTAIHTADAFIKSGIYENILIVNGEKLSDAISYNIVDEKHLKRVLASFTLGDAGTAVLINASDDESGFYHQEFMTDGNHWKLCTVPGGGSMFPHDLSKLYFEGKTKELREAMVVHSQEFVVNAIKNSGWVQDNIDHVITHQVSQNTFEVIAESTGFKKEKFVNTFDLYGNTAAASIPLSMVYASENQTLKKGDKLAIIGLGAGISVSVQMLIW